MMGWTQEAFGPERRDAFQSAVWVTIERGLVRLTGRETLRRIAAANDSGGVT